MNTKKHVIKSPHTQAFTPPPPPKLDSQKIVLALPPIYENVQKVSSRFTAHSLKYAIIYKKFTGGWRGPGGQ